MFDRGNPMRMRVLQLDVRCFRSLYDVSWSPGDLNVVIGPNGSGKSNLLKSLEMLSAAAQGRLSKQVQLEGGMGSLVWDGQASLISFRLKTSPIEPHRDIHRDSLTYCLDLRWVRGLGGYQIEHELLGNYCRVESGEMDQPFKFLERDTRNAVVHDEHQKGLYAPDESVSPEETLLSIAAGPFTANRWIPMYRKNLADWRIYQDFQTHRESLVRQLPFARRDTLVAPDGHNLVSVLHTLYTDEDRDFKRDLDAAMAAAFGEDFDALVFQPAADDQRIQLRIRWKSLQRGQTTAELSDGTLRFLLLVAVLANPKPPPLIAIDEPAMGLHPSILPIVAEYAVEASTRSQVILTTHSADFLDAFGDSPPKTTVARWKEGKTYLQVVSDESLRYWLQEYTLGKLYRSGELEDLE